MESSLSYLLAISICFLGSCFFSLAETALTALTPVQSQRIIENGGWFGRSLRHWIKQPNRLLATILVCNTLANTTAAAIGTLFVEKFYPEFSVAAATMILTLLVLVIGEMAPKMLARSYAENLAPYACRILVLFNYIFYPLTYLLTGGVSVVLGAFGIIMNKRQAIRPADIEYMVLLAGREGSIERDKTKILSSVFEFSKRRVKDIMIPRDKISAISVDANLMEVLDIVRQENHSRYPVYNQSLDRVVGFLHARDLFGMLRTYGFTNQSALSSISLRTCLRRAFFVSEHSMISRVLNEMKSNRIHLGIVKDEWGNVVGLITLEDILEEIFGEIEDEHDEHIARPIPDLYATGVEVEGSESLVDLKSKYEIDIEPAESYSTLNGFLQHYASHQNLTPKTVIIWNNYVFSILGVKDGEVEKVRITEIPEDKKD
jgi:putative hemolysin